MLARQHARPQALLQHRERALEPAPVDEIEQMEAAVVGEREHGAERRLEPLGVQHADVAARDGAVPTRRVNASRNPLPDSKPWSSCESSTVFPFLMSRSARPMRRAR